MQTYDLATLYMKFDLPPMIMLLLFSSPTHATFLFSNLLLENPIHLQGAIAGTHQYGTTESSARTLLFGCFGHRPPIFKR